MMNKRTLNAGLVCAALLLVGCDGLFGTSSDDDDGVSPVDSGVTTDVPLFGFDDTFTPGGGSDSGMDPDSGEPIDLADYGVGGPCGEIDFFGTCDDDVLLFCDADDILQGRHCPSAGLPNLQCQLVNDEWGFDCTAPTGGQCADTDGSNVSNCAGDGVPGCVQQSAEAWVCEPNVGLCDGDSLGECRGDVLVTNCGGSGQAAGPDCTAFGLTCLEGLCSGAVEGDGCNELVRCVDGFFCSNGVCRESGDECVDEFDCIPGRDCMGGFCAQGGPCLAEEDCDEGTVCSQGLCVEEGTPICDVSLERFITLSSDADVVELGATNCPIIPWDLTITGDVTDLTPLGLVELVGATLTITGTSQLETLDGLQALTRVGAQLQIEGNPGLATVQGLNNLRQVDDDLIINDNPGLRAVPMTSLQRAGTIGVDSNDSLEAIDFSSLHEVDSVSFSNNTILPECAVDSLREQLLALGFDGSFDNTDNDPDGVCP